MKTTVYVDVLFLVNFVINYLLLYITSLLCKTNTKQLRLAAASCIGAVYSVCMFVPEFSVITSLIAKVVLSFVIVFVSFGVKSIKKYIKQLCFFYAVSFVCAGLVTALAYSNSSLVYTRGGIVYLDTNTLTIVIAALVSYCLIRITFGIYRKYSLRDYLGMVVYKDGKAVNITVLVDTGNLLIDPLGGGPVIVVEQSAIRGIVGNGDVFEKMNQIDGVRLIPIKTIDSDNGLLVGFKPDKICCRTPVRDDAIIAVTPKKFNADYNALAGPHSFAD